MLIAFVVASVILIPTNLGSGGGCSDSDLVTGGCGVDNTGTEIIIDGSRETDGDPGYSPVDNDWQPPVDQPWTPREPTDLDRCVVDWESYRGCYVAAEEAENEADEDETPALPAVTITDLARFAPAGSVITGEPGNVGVAGLPTNFVTTASVQTVEATLFGFPVSVRFTPSVYDFSFGDDSTATATSGGTTWADLGQAQFTPTDTSHTYTERGTYAARVDVRYTAEVDFGVGWFPITGEVTSIGPAQEVRIFEAHTALVAHTCAQAPSSPGC